MVTKEKLKKIKLVLVGFLTLVLIGLVSTQFSITDTNVNNKWYNEMKSSYDKCNDVSRPADSLFRTSWCTEYWNVLVKYRCEESSINNYVQGIEAFCPVAEHDTRICLAGRNTGDTALVDARCSDFEANKYHCDLAVENSIDLEVKTYCDANTKSAYFEAIRVAEAEAKALRDAQNEAQALAELQLKNDRCDKALADADSSGVKNNCETPVYETFQCDRGLDLEKSSLVERYCDDLQVKRFNIDQLAKAELKKVSLQQETTLISEADPVTTPQTFGCDTAISNGDSAKVKSECSFEKASLYFDNLELDTKITADTKANAEPTSPVTLIAGLSIMAIIGIILFTI